MDFREFMAETSVLDSLFVEWTVEIAVEQGLLEAQSLVLPGFASAGDIAQRKPEVDRKAIKELEIDAYGRDQPMIGKYAQKSPENMAQVAMFSPLSARTLFADMKRHYPAIVFIMRYLLSKGDRRTSAKELDELLKQHFAYGGAKAKGVVFGFKLDTVADIWNRRKEIYSQAMNLDAKDDGAGLLKLFSSIPGVAPVKAGFIVQLIFGKLGCIDVHNARIYQQAAQELGWKSPSPKEFNPAAWDKGSEAKTERNIKTYLALLEKLKEHGIDTAALWNIWVDFMATIYQYASTYAPTPSQQEEEMWGPAIDPQKEPYAQFKGFEPTTKISMRGKGGGAREADVRAPVAAGDIGGSHVSWIHRLAGMDPEEMIKYTDIPDVYSRYQMRDWPKMSPEDIRKRMKSPQRSLF
jgi:hypothetical protein